MFIEKGRDIAKNCGLPFLTDRSGSNHYVYLVPFSPFSQLHNS